MAGRARTKPAQILAANAPLNNNLPQTADNAGGKSDDFASQLSAMRATKGGATGLPTPVEQVMLELSRGLSKDGSTQMSIQLRPAELGRLMLSSMWAATAKCRAPTPPIILRH